MLKYSFIILLISIILTSCSKNHYFQKDVKKIANELYKMKESDQMVRNQKQYFDYYFGANKFYHTLDSLTWTGNKKVLDSFISGTTKIRINSKDFNELKNIDYKYVTMRNRTAMEYIDSVTVSELIRITKKYGFPSHERLLKELGTQSNKNLTSSPHIIFVHTPNYFVPEVRKLIIQEYLKGRIDKNACSHVFWHLNGRVGNPFSDNYEHCKVDTLR
jgi:hypothetical protein